jgi:hypothetical protein
VVKESKTRYVCRLLSDGLLPRVRCFRSLTLTSTRPPFFPFLACLLFCREFDLLHAPETRMNSGGDFSTINKRDHFVESLSTGRDNRFRVALRQTHLASGVFPTMLRMPNSA